MADQKPSSDKAIFEALRTELFTAVVGDVLDVLGYCHQFLPAGISSLQPDMKVVGRAMPVLEADVFSDGSPSAHGPLANKPFGLMMEVLDDLKENEVYIATGASLRYALWGGLMSTRARHLKAAGAILDGYIRDSSEIEGIRIESGDLVFGDREGVLIIPHAVEAETIERTLEKVRTENEVAVAIRKGMSACEAFSTFGVM